ncbi:MAG: hypothetical protein LQ343_001381 [Gyalolechia ehrenbergii]|nr:MAG: hypothetical protein LQ343_001381 [Gyalolechia ehrenbergii]
MSQSSFTLPLDFLSKPAPNIQLQRIDFTKTPLPEYKGLYAVVLDNVLTKDEWDDLIRVAEATTGGKWEQAMVNVGGGQQKLITDTRDCGRIIWDDKAVVAKIWDRVKESVPEIQSLKGMARVTGYGPVKRGETLAITRLNERMRFLKYTEGQYFQRGGATRFHSLSWDDKKYFDVMPQVGRVLIFQHRDLLHSGDDLIKGTKYTLRTDLMYTKLAEEEK